MLVILATNRDSAATKGGYRIEDAEIQATYQQSL